MIARRRARRPARRVPPPAVVHLGAAAAAARARTCSCSRPSSPRVGGPDLPLEVSAIDSYPSVTDAPETSAARRRAPAGVAAAHPRRRRGAVRDARPVPQREPLPAGAGARLDRLTAPRPQPVLRSAVRIRTSRDAARRGPPSQAASAQAVGPRGAGRAVHAWLAPGGSCGLPTLPPCRCARTAATTNPAPTPTARWCGSASSTSRPRRRGGARTTARASTGACSTPAGRSAASARTSGRRSSPSRGRGRRRAARRGRGHRERRRARHPRRVREAEAPVRQAQEAQVASPCDTGVRAEGVEPSPPKGPGPKPGASAVPPRSRAPVSHVPERSVARTSDKDRDLNPARLPFRHAREWLSVTRRGTTTWWLRRRRRSSSATGGE